MEKQNSLRKGIFLGVLSAITFGTIGTFVNLLGDYGMSTDALTVILPFVLTIYFGIVIYLRNKQAFKIPKKMLFFLIVLGFVGFDGQNYCMNQAYIKLPFGLVAAIMFTNVFLVMIGSRIVFGNKITTLKIGAGVVCAVGVAMVLDLYTVIQTGGFSFDASSLLWVLGGLVTIAGTYVGSKYAMEKEIDGLVVFFYMNLFAVLVWWAAVYSPIQMTQDIVNVIAAGGLPTFLAYVIITCVICFHLWAAAIEAVDPSWVGISYSFDPIVEILLGFIIFNQTMNGLQISGVILIFAAVCFVTYLDGKEATITATNNV